MRRRYLPATAALLVALSTSLGSAALTEGGPAQPLHIVRAGETLWSISEMHQVAPEAIGRVNRLPALDRLQIGDRLIIPESGNSKNERTPQVTAGGVHVVQSGETLWSIARSHGTTAVVLAGLNGLGNADRIQLGQRILVKPGQSERSKARRGSSIASSPRRDPAPLRRVFAWPSRGVITSRFGFRGRRHHHGIDIAAPVGTPIFAAQDGQVQYVGRMGGYGTLVILDHGGGLSTWYGHASRVLVTLGQRVRRGQAIALVGTTGEVTGPNVHFEVRRNNTPLDPLAYLQSGR